MTRRVAILLLAGCLPVAIWAGGGADGEVPVVPKEQWLRPGEGRASESLAAGDQFQVNSYTTQDQELPAVAIDGDGDFVVAWQSKGSGGSDSSEMSIQARRFAADGTARGSDFQVNTYTTDSQRAPVVGVDAEGDFVVVWYSDVSGGSDTSGSSVWGQRYASDGTAQGGEFQVNTYTTDSQAAPAVAVAADGDFVVVWHSGNPGRSRASGTNVQGQRYASDGTAQGGEFRVNTYSTSLQLFPAVRAAANGDFVVVWYSYGSSGSDIDAYCIAGQRYASDGTAQGSQFQVNTYTTGLQVFPAVGVGAEGDFVVVWQTDASSGSDTSSYGIAARRFASDGTAQGSEFQVNTYTTDTQRFADVAVAADGDFVVVWQSYGSSGSDDSASSIQGQRYASDGTALGGEFQVNSYTTSVQRLAAVAMAANGDFLAVWHSLGPTDSDPSLSIQGQRYLSFKIFADGFESGNTSSWTSTVP